MRNGAVFNGCPVFIKGKSKVKKRFFLIPLILSTILATGAVISFSLYFKDRAELTRTEEEIEKIREKVISYKDEDGDGISEEDPRDRIIDFEKLYVINEDVAFWLYIPGTPIDYPVMAEADGRGYYLYHDIYGDTGSWGSLFSYESSLASDMPIIYGHHVTGYDPAFGKLEDYLDEVRAEDIDTAYVYLPDGSVEVYSLYAVLDTTTGDAVYKKYYYAGTDEWDELLLHLKETSTYPVPDEDPEEKMIMLSTCKVYATNKRIAVIFFKTA